MRAIVFDKDGTLLDFQATYGPATRDVLRALDGDFERMAKAIGYDAAGETFAPSSPVIAGSNADVLDALRGAGASVSLEELDALFAETSVPHAALLPGVTEALAALDRPLAIATNDAEACARLQLERVGLLDRFRAVVGYDSGHGAKPEPGMILACAAHLECGPADVAFVGDSLTDCRAGRAAGVFTVAVTTGEASAEELEPHADAVIAALAELAPLLDQ